MNNTMLNKERHKLVMTQILKDIYADMAIASLLGFKGGTAAYLFYDLPRFSVDLDFDLLDASEENKKLVFEKVRKILMGYGEIKDEQMKFATIFFALSYGSGEPQIKIEINTRKTGAGYETKSYLGIPMLVAMKEAMLAGKLIALTARKEFAARDLFDGYFFLKNMWDFDRNVFRAYGVENSAEYLEKCIALIERVPDNNLLKGLGELIDEKQKAFVKEKLKREIIFLLRAALEREKKIIQI